MRHLKKVVKNGVLSLDTTDDNFYGNYLYVGMKNGKFVFKHFVTGELIYG